MKSWLILLTAIVAEVVGTSALKASESFSKPLPSAIVVLAFAVAFYCLSITLRSIPVGVAYAVWSGVGTVLITVVGWKVFGQALSLPAVFGIGLIVIGVV
ncbi:MAG: multidrug efflux SMR transporter, partial [Gammaproteobacteria bacterium]|nr:multidrug efflux SMR transporter [Gammaproteobacteria bacterium]